MQPLQPTRRFTLTLNSHSLSNFQRCEELYRLRDIKNLVPVDPYYPFVRGALLSRVFELWYKGKKLGYSKERLEDLEFKLAKILLKHKDIYEEDRVLISTRMVQYFEKYREQNCKVVAVEQGFSRVLYEDQHVLFIYEGRPDLIVDFGEGFGICPVDHKSESRKSDIYEFNNQFMGYSWAIGTLWGIINYFGMQSDSDKGKVLRQTTFNFTAQQLEQWRADTIRWYFRIMRAMVNGDYLRSWNCEGKYGTCVYHDICEQPIERMKLVKIKNYYREEEAHRSW